MPVLLARVGKRAAAQRGGREPHRRLVHGTRPRAPASARSSSRSTTTSCRERRRGLALHRDRVACSRSPSRPTGRSSRCRRRRPRCPRRSSSTSSNVLRSSVAELDAGRGPARAAGRHGRRRPRRRGPGAAARLRRRARRRTARPRARARARRHVVRRDARRSRFERSEDEAGTVELTVKEIKEKVLPPLDDELARAASEFDTLDRASRGHRVPPARADRGGDRGRRPRRRGRRARRGDRRARPAARSSRPRARDAPERPRPLARRAAASALETYLPRLPASRRASSSSSVRGEAAQSVARELVLEARRRPARDRGGRRARSRRSSASRPRRPGTIPTSCSQRPARRRRVRGPARGPPPARGARPGRRRGQADPGRAGRGPRGDLDTREGKTRDTDEVVDPRQQGALHEPA